MELKEILTKIGYVRNTANLSAREVSLRIGMSPQYVAKVESGQIVLTMEKLLAILEVCNFPIEKFFYEKSNEYETDQTLLTLIKQLPMDKKEHIIGLIQK